MKLGKTRITIRIIRIVRGEKSCILSCKVRYDLVQTLIITCTKS